MDERHFLHSVQRTSQTVGINSLLLLSGIEGLYTFRDVELSHINYSYLDSLILTIFALRIGDHFHSLAEENLTSTSDALRTSAQHELRELTEADINKSQNQYLQSFAKLLAGKSVIRKYHEKALEAAAVEIEKTQARFQTNSISTIVLHICRTHLQNTVNLGSVFN